LTSGIKQIFINWSIPKGNADTGRVTRTLKEDLIWPYDNVSAQELLRYFLSLSVSDNRESSKAICCALFR